MATHSYSLQWGDHQTMLSSAVMNCSPDVTLVCDDVHIPANSLVLSACSTLFYSLIKEAPPSMISLPDINHDHLHSLLTFLQNGELKGNKDYLGQVLAIAEHLEMHCFSVQKTESGKKTLSTNSGDTDLEFCEVPEKEDSLYIPDEKTKDMICEEEYLKMKRRLVDKSLKKASEPDGRTSLKCDICGKKWVGNVSKDRRRAVRHMGLHLQVRVRCSLCGVSLKSVESFYFHKTKFCKNKSKSQEASSVVKERIEENEKVVKDDEWLAVNSPRKPDISGKRVTESIGTTLRNEVEGKKMEEDMAKVNNDWYCLICGKFWHAKGRCKRHMLTHFPCKLPCVVCGEMFSSKYLLQKHENRCHVESSSDSVILKKSEDNSIETGLTKINSDLKEHADQSTLESSIDEANNNY